MSALTVDSSVWIEFFRGQPLPALEDALARGFVIVPPVVVAELLSAPLSARKRAALADMLSDLPIHPAPFEHWAAVGALRARLLRVGVSVSTPDAHVAQCALECSGLLWSRDAVFTKIAKHCSLQLFGV